MKIDAILPNNFKPLIGNMKVHQYTWNKLKSNCILFNSLSCFDCFNGNLCRHFSMGRIDYSFNHKIEKTNKKLMKRTKKYEDSLQEAEKSPNLTKNLKCLQKDVANDYPAKIQTVSLRRNSRIQKML